MYAPETIQRSASLTLLNLDLPRFATQLVTSYSGFETRLSLADCSPELSAVVSHCWVLESKQLLKSYGIKVRLSALRIRDDSKELQRLMRRITDDQFLVISPRCAMFFAKTKKKRRSFVVAKFNAANASVIGWKLASAKRNRIQRPMAKPRTASLPRLELCLEWETRLRPRAFVQQIAVCNELVAVGTHSGQLILLSPANGEVVDDSLKGQLVCALSRGQMATWRQIPVPKYGLCEPRAELRVYSGGSEKVSVICGVTATYSIFATADGRRVVLTDSPKKRIVELSAEHLTVSALTPFDAFNGAVGTMARNGLFAQKYCRKGERRAFRIALIDTDTRCVAQIFNAPKDANVTGVDFSPNCQSIAAVSNDSVYLLDALTGALLGDARPLGGDRGTEVCWLSDELFAASLEGGSMAVWHRHCPEAVARKAADERLGFATAMTRFADDSFISASGNWVRKWKLTKPKTATRS